MCLVCPLRENGSVAKGENDWSKVADGVRSPYRYDSMIPMIVSMMGIGTIIVITRTVQRTSTNNKDNLPTLTGLLLLLLLL